jgi:vacuolar-type H+-ATPase subunit H
MCDPISIVGFAFSAASQVMSYNAQADAAVAQANEQNRRYNEAAMSGARSLQDQQLAEAQRLDQERVKTGQEMIDLKKDVLQQQGALAAAGSSGGGMSEALLSADLTRQELNYTDIISYNLDNTLQQSTWNMKGAVADQQGNTNQYYPTGVQMPSKGAALMNIAGAGLNAYTGYKANQAPGSTGIDPVQPKKPSGIIPSIGGYNVSAGRR